MTDSNDPKEPERKRHRKLWPTTTTGRIAATLIGTGAALGTASVILSTPIESGQGTTIGGLAVLGGAALTFHSANLTRMQTSTDENAKLEEQQNARNQLHHREVMRDIQTRFSTSTTQLANDAATIRLAGVYSLASLADDWYAAIRSEVATGRERQVCIEVLCAYLRRDTTGRSSRPEHDDEWTEDADELIVRAAVVATIAAHMTRRLDVTDAPSWRGAALNLRQANLRDAQLADSELSNTDLRGADLTGADLHRVTAHSAYFGKAYLRKATLSAGSFDDAQFQRAKLNNASLLATQFQRAKMEYAELMQVNGTAANFSGADLYRARISDAILVNAKIQNARLVKADLTDANLTGATFNNADLSYANLTGADVTRTVFDGADLSGADLRKCNLRTASFQNVTLNEDAIWPNRGRPRHMTIRDARHP